jgi:hypothetical protein
MYRLYVNGLHSIETVLELAIQNMYNLCTTVQFRDEILLKNMYHFYPECAWVT